MQELELRLDEYIHRPHPRKEEIEVDHKELQHSEVNLRIGHKQLNRIR